MPEATTLKSFAEIPTLDPAPSSTEAVPSQTLAAVDDAWEQAEKMTDDPGDSARQPADPDRESPKEDGARDRDDQGKFKPKAVEKPEPPLKGADEPKKPAPDAAKDAPSVAEDEEDADEKVEKFKLPKGAHPRSYQILDELKKQSKERGQRNRELKAKVREFETRLAEASKAAPVADEERAELERLREFEFIQNPERSARITRQFDAPLAAVKDSLAGMLKAHGLPEEHLKEYAEKGPDFRPAGWWEKAVLTNEALPWNDREKFKRLLSDHYGATEARAEAIQKAARDRQTFEATLKQQEQKQGEEFWNRVKTSVADLQAKEEFAAPKEIPANASKEERARIAAHNERIVKVLQPAFVEAVESIGDPEKLARTGMRVVESLYLRDELKRVESEHAKALKRAEEAEQRLSNIESSRRISQARSASTSATRPPNPFKASVDDNFDRAEAMTAGRG